MNLNKKNNSGRLLLIIAIVVGFIFRFYKLGHVPVSLYWDEAAIGYDAYSLSLTGRDMHGLSGLQAIYPSYGDYKLPMYIWIDAMAVKVFGPTPFAVRLPSALAGMGLIILLYFITLELFKSRILAGLASLIQAILPVDVLFSRTGFEGHLAVFFIAFTLFLWLKSRKRPILTILASFTAAAAVYSYFSARIVIPIIGIMTFIAFFKSTSWRWRGLFVVSLGLFFLLLMPILKSSYYSPSNTLRLSTTNLSDTGFFAMQSNIDREQSGNGLLSRLVYHRYLLQAKALISHVAAHFDPLYLFIEGDSNLRHSTRQVGLLFVGFLPLFITGWAGLLRKQTIVGAWLFGIWLASIIPAAIPMEVPHALRSMDATIIFPVVIAYGLSYLSQTKWKWINVYAGLFILIETGLFAHDYLTHYPARSATSWQYGYAQLATYLAEHDSEYDHVVIDYSDWRLYLYILLFQKVDPRTLPNQADFIYHKFGKYSFAEVKTITSDPRTMNVVSPDQGQSLHAKPFVTLNDYAGSPEFYLLKGDRK